MNQQLPHKFPAWAEKYIALVKGNALQEMENQLQDFPNFINNWIEKADFAYAPGKWTIRQLTSHILDTERILMYRLLCIARGDKQSLPGFDENLYVANTLSNTRSLFEMSEEFRSLRKSNLLCIGALTDEELDRVGTANQLEISARDLVYILVGHINHHQNVITERYS